MKKLHLIYLSLMAISLIANCATKSSGDKPPVDITMPPPTDITTAKTIHAHVNDDADNATVINLAASITVTEPTYSILEGNDDNIFSIDSSTGLISLADASKITYDAADKTNNIHLLKVQVRNGTDSTKATEAPLRIVVRGENGAFITTWETTEMNETIIIPTTGSGYNFTVDWGDMAETTYSNRSGAGFATHDYVAAKTYTVIITGTFPRIHFNNTADDRTKIQTVEQWGSTAWDSMLGAFHGAENLTVPAVDAPNLSGVTIMRSMFNGTTVFNQDISHWDTSGIQTMDSMFAHATAFNQDISNWNTAMVNNMSSMFFNAAAFNQDISGWNTAMVTNMNGMFSGARVFNQDIKDWDVDAVTNCTNFSGGGSGLADTNLPAFTCAR